MGDWIWEKLSNLLCVTQGIGWEPGVFDAEALCCTYCDRDYIYINVLSIVICILFVHSIFQGKNHVLLQKLHALEENQYNTNISKVYGAVENISRKISLSSMLTQWNRKLKYKLSVKQFSFPGRKSVSSSG